MNDWIVEASAEVVKQRLHSFFRHRGWLLDHFETSAFPRRRIGLSWPSWISEELVLQVLCIQHDPRRTQVSLLVPFPTVILRRTLALVAAGFSSGLIVFVVFLLAFIPHDPDSRVTTAFFVRTPLALCFTALPLWALSIWIVDKATTLVRSEIGRLHLDFEAEVVRPGLAASHSIPSPSPGAGGTATPPASPSPPSSPLPLSNPPGPRAARIQLSSADAESAWTILLAGVLLAILAAIASREPRVALLTLLFIAWFLPFILLVAASSELPLPLAARSRAAAAYAYWVFVLILPLILYFALPPLLHITDWWPDVDHSLTIDPDTTTHVPTIDFGAAPEPLGRIVRGFVVAVLVGGTLSLQLDLARNVCVPLAREWTDVRSLLPRAVAEDPREDAWRDAKYPPSDVFVAAWLSWSTLVIMTLTITILEVVRALRFLGGGGTPGPFWTVALEPFPFLPFTAALALGLTCLAALLVPLIATVLFHALSTIRRFGPHRLGAGAPVDALLTTDAPALRKKGHILRTILDNNLGSHRTRLRVTASRPEVEIRNVGLISPRYEITLSVPALVDADPQDLEVLVWHELGHHRSLGLSPVLNILSILTPWGPAFVRLALDTVANEQQADLQCVRSMRGPARLRDFLKRHPGEPPGKPLPTPNRPPRWADIIPFIRTITSWDPPLYAHPTLDRRLRAIANL